MSTTLIRSNFLPELFYITSQIVLPIAQRFAEEEDKGGCLCVASSNGHPLLVGYVGGPAEERAGRFWVNALEKAARLGKNTGDISSFQSRNPDNRQWAGAVRGSHVIISFSGLPELIDEALVLGLLRIKGMIADDRVAKVIAASNNTKAEEIFTFMYPLARGLVK